MQQVEAIADLRAVVRRWRQAGESIAFVPTMGNLHAGHLDLVGRAQELADRTVVSIFVNPLQFGPREDYAAYPRTLERDRTLLQSAGADLLFAPSVQAIYPQGQQDVTRVHVPRLSDILCGAFRPGHFDGVATIVAKLFNLVQPDCAIFGKKDYQQWRLIESMVSELAIPVSIVGAPTVREQDGLAMSSRNQYLSSEERRRAPELYKCLSGIRDRLVEGDRNFGYMQAQAMQQLESLGFRPQYVEIRNPWNLASPDADTREYVVLAAAYLGQTRLIDNLEILPT
ncbi:MAG TPA: pantoate--beta-alanine ligase [Gammaproteobacteria bacterium]|nr:pantoate--beta-alanine ligase [Gammaproteobacteria bacterium]